MDSEGSGPASAPRPRPFPCLGTPPGPRCGHTLTAVAGPDGEVASAKLILFGERLSQEGADLHAQDVRPLASSLVSLVSSGRVAALALLLTCPGTAGGATALEGSQRSEGGAPASPGPASGTGAIPKPAGALIMRKAPGQKPKARCLTNDAPALSQVSGWRAPRATCTYWTCGREDGNACSQRASLLLRGQHMRLQLWAAWLLCR